ncbi:hypothetical protein LR48_Vigan01g109700 [Vigna angularis]|uniref:Uncharacterized protein n=1 Tax=Phaseolus angularis TaxID=3914 RepID=A0A0L9TM82_PHAAN|nr:hypothetical protein LR48_Vigan01g109700 [Vigna angularis]
MEMEEDEKIPIILGRPFMKTAKVIINVDDGMIVLQDQEEKVREEEKDGKGRTVHDDLMDAQFKLDTLKTSRTFLAIVPLYSYVSPLPSSWREASPPFVDGITGTPLPKKHSKWNSSLHPGSPAKCGHDQVLQISPHGHTIDEYRRSNDQRDEMKDREKDEKKEELIQRVDKNHDVRPPLNGTVNTISEGFPWSGSEPGRSHGHNCRSEKIWHKEVVRCMVARDLRLLLAFMVVCLVACSVASLTLLCGGCSLLCVTHVLLHASCESSMSGSGEIVQWMLEVDYTVGVGGAKVDHE